ncbi:MAG: SCP2 sterol-binding domain-containing protein [Anaerolineales bacterium]|jgi:putative sterol carrier protein
MDLAFPSQAWLEALIETLNSDDRYAQIARNWEGDFAFTIEPDDSNGDENTYFYLDLWHGQCRGGQMTNSMEEMPKKPDFVMSATLSVFKRVLSGDLDPMQGMLTRKLRVQGNMGYILRNVPTVLEFVRCCQTVPIE